MIFPRHAISLYPQLTAAYVLGATSPSTMRSCLCKLECTLEYWLYGVLFT
jgi:hypothetical protein